MITRGWIDIDGDLFVKQRNRLLPKFLPQDDFVLLISGDNIDVFIDALKKLKSDPGLVFKIKNGKVKYGRQY